jgi:hypothetical protein
MKFTPQSYLHKQQFPFGVGVDFSGIGFYLSGTGFAQIHGSVNLHFSPFTLRKIPR